MILTMFRLLFVSSFFNVFIFYFICFGFTGQKVVGVILEDGTKVTADAVVLTTGTFLRGVIQIGACGLRLLACSILCIESADASCVGTFIVGYLNNVPPRCVMVFDATVSGLTCYHYCTTRPHRFHYMPLCFNPILQCFNPILQYFNASMLQY